MQYGRLKKPKKKERNFQSPGPYVRSLKSPLHFEKWNVCACLLSPCNPMGCSQPGSSVQGDSPGKNTAGVDCHFLLQGIFLTQGSNPGLPHCRQNFYHLSLQGRPRILEWVAYSFSRGSFQPINWTGVSCIAGRFFTN